MGSQEGPFENVRLNLNGDQGQILKQLVTSNAIRRVAMCSFSSIKGKKQHITVNHDKGKVREGKVGEGGQGEGGRARWGRSCDVLHYFGMSFLQLTFLQLFPIQSDSNRKKLTLTVRLWGGACVVVWEYKFIHMGYSN